MPLPLFIKPAGFGVVVATAGGNAFADQWQTNAIAGGGTISSTAYNATTAFANTLEASGTLAKLNLLWHMSGDYAASKYLLKYPSGHPGSVTYSGFSSSQYSEATGITSTGAEYADLSYVPNTYQLSADVGSALLYAHTNNSQIYVTSPGILEFGVISASSGTSYWRCHKAPGVSVSDTNTNGLYIGNRTGPSYSELSRNGTVISTFTTPGSSTMPVGSVFAFANNYNDGGTIGIFKGAARMSLVAIGEALNNTDISTINSAYTAYAAAIGRSLP